MRTNLTERRPEPTRWTADRASRRIAVGFLASAVLACPVDARPLVKAQSAFASRYRLDVRGRWAYFEQRGATAQVVRELTSDATALGLSKADALVPMLDPRAGVKGEAADAPVRLRQLHLGLRVEGAELTLHQDAQQRVRLMHGRLASDLPSSREPLLTAGQALEMALARVGAARYAWQDPQWERQRQLDSNGGDAASYLPKGELYYARLEPGASFEASPHRLAYRFEVRTLEPDDLREVVVDADTGDLLRNQSLMHDAIGTVHTLYDGPRNFSTWRRGFPYFDYVLKDQERGDKMHTLRWSSSTPWWLRPEIDDRDNTWFEPAATAHWVVQMAWDYYWNRHGRNGLDNGGGKIRIEADWPDPNARFYRDGGYDYLRFGGSGSFGTLDVAGHEFTHGVAAHTANLDGIGLPGALGESFGDIFGVMTEAFVEGGIFNWTVGEDIAGVGALRSLADPNLMGDPDTFGGLFWINPADLWNDDGGVHNNNGVQNFWFFLLANGGAGVNDLGNPFAVQGVGADVAGRIAYRNLDVYIQQLSDFDDSREGAINAARDLYGACSRPTTSTTNAWNAVGVGERAAPCVRPIAPEAAVFCVERDVYARAFTIYTFPEDAPITWQVPPQWSHIVSPDGRTLQLTGNSAPEIGVDFINATAIIGGLPVTRAASLEIRSCRPTCFDRCEEP